MLQKIGLFLFGLIFLLTILTVFSLQKIPQYQKQLGVSSSFFLLKQPPKKAEILQGGWAKANITPTGKVALAGYGISRPQTDFVHDSIFAKVFVFNNGLQKAAFVSVDLMIMPPALVENILQTLKKDGFSRENLFFTATHTHHGAGEWAEGVAGWALAGGYEQQTVDFMAQRVVAAIRSAEQQQQQVSIGFVAVDAPEFVAHRFLDKPLFLDTHLRALKIKQKNGETAALITYSAHAICVSHEFSQISRDYVGDLVDGLERSKKVDFAVFGAGMVASHIPKDLNKSSYDYAYAIGKGLANKLLNVWDTVAVQEQKTLKSAFLPLSIDKMRPRVSDDYCLHPAIFEALSGKQTVGLSVLQIGNNVFFGTPCDFSGEFADQINKTAQKTGFKAIVTSFNGAYTGYFVPEQHFKETHAELREMNWTGRGAGEKVTATIISLMNK